MSQPQYVFRWIETTKPYGEDGEAVVNGPYEIKGNALAISRVSIHLRQSAFVSGEILTEDGKQPGYDRYMADCVRVTCDMAGFPHPKELEGV